jgi:retron-type reverse transcriptase
LRDPKTRVIRKSTFRDRVVHHAIVNILEPIYEEVFIYDSYANRKGKGTSNALKRYDAFLKKVTKNGQRIPSTQYTSMVKGYVLKADYSTF